jgi:hypothetical protein
MNHFHNTKNHMKKHYLLLTFLAFASVGKTQTLNGQSLSELKARYIEIVGTSKILKPLEVTIYVDYGQVSKISEIENGYVLDQNGENMTFNGMLAAVNLFAEYGYVLDMAYPLTTSSGNVYHYIMRKEQ